MAGREASVRCAGTRPGRCQQAKRAGAARSSAVQLVRKRLHHLLELMDPGLVGVVQLLDLAVALLPLLPVAALGHGVSHAPLGFVFGLGCGRCLMFCRHGRVGGCLVSAMGQGVPHSEVSLVRAGAVRRGPAWEFVDGGWWMGGWTNGRSRRRLRSRRMRRWKSVSQ